MCFCTVRIRRLFGFVTYQSRCSLWRVQLCVFVLCCAFGPVFVQLFVGRYARWRARPVDVVLRCVWWNKFCLGVMWTSLFLMREIPSCHPEQRRSRPPCTLIRLLQKSEFSSSLVEMISNLGFFTQANNAVIAIFLHKRYFVDCAVLHADA